MGFSSFAGEEDAPDGDRQESEDLAGAGENTYHHVRRGDGQKRHAGKEVDSQRPYNRPCSEAIEDLRFAARGRGGSGFRIFQGRFSQFVTCVSWPGRPDPLQVRSRFPTLPRDILRRLRMPEPALKFRASVKFHVVKCRSRGEVRPFSRFRVRANRHRALLLFFVLILSRTVS